MSSSDFVFLPSNIPAGQTANLSLNLVAPDVAGKYQGNWQLEAPDGKIFGVGDAAEKPFWVRIRVITPSINTMTSTPVISSATPTLTLTSAPSLPITYDFAASACSAQWESSHGLLPCPGTDGDARGFVLILDQAKLEDGTVVNLPALLTFPEFVNKGFIQGIYSDYQVQAGDRLQAIASCENGAAACSALFQISYIDSSGGKHILWTIGEFYDGMYSNVNLDLTALAGQKVKFVLSVSALGSPVGDRALWIAPHIVRFTAPLPTATSTSTAITSPVPPASTNTATPTATLTPIPTATQPTGQGNPVSSPSFTEIINQIISFFRRLLGH